MTDRNRVKNLHRQEAQRRQAQRKRQRRQRRGVLLIVVLSMLVLFMLLGTTFLMTSSQYRTAAKSAARLNQVENKPSDLLERALKQVLRDTQNPASVVRYHSLLRDMYGSDGFQGRIYAPQDNEQLLNLKLAKFARSPADWPPNGPNGTDEFGSTRGQIVEFLIDQPGLHSSVAAKSLATPLRLEADATGAIPTYTLPQVDGYFNGCLLTMLSGPAAGQSTRIVSYDFIGAAAAGPGNPPLPLWRIRVMAFPRADGQSLQPLASGPRLGELSDLVTASGGFYFGHSFMINGRPFNGTGVGYNPLAAVGTPRLSAAQAIPIAGSTVPEFMQVALAPNAVFHDSTAIVGDLAMPLPNYPFQGPGDTDESYDAADFQNMYLALLSVMPRARGQVMDTLGTIGIAGLVYDVDDPRVGPLLADFTNYRPVIDDVPLPSFHRPDLVHYWFQRMFSAPWLDSLSEQQRTIAILQPYQANGNPSPGLNAQQAAQITAIKRKMILRPLREDHPNFDGSNPLSRQEQSLAPWHVIGPWDVDNDNDGIPDSIWVDLGDPIQETADGRLYKPLYAFLVVDQDGKLNLNAHGSSEHIANVNLDQSGLNLAHNPDPNLGHIRTSNLLAAGSGWGPAEISLRPIFPAPVDGGGAPIVSVTGNDDYLRLLVGRPNIRIDGNGNSVPDSPVPWGRHGSEQTALASGLFTPPPGEVFSRPGVTFNGTLPNPNPTRDPHTLYDFAGYPEFSNSPFSSFGHLPDLFGRYAVGLDYTGQPVYETAYEPTPRRMVDDSPYELNFTEPHRNDIVADSQAMMISYGTAAPINDDAPFAPSELERLVRAYDADASALPDRLWNLVDAFDPAKLATTQPYLNNFSDASARLAQAQMDASINRRVVTTESWDVPAPAGSFLARCQLGADGLPGTINNRVLNDGQTVWPDAAASFDPDNLANSCDDYFVIMGETPPSGATIVDYLRYRIVLELKKKKLFTPDTLASAPAVQLAVNPIIQQLMAPEVLASLKMDLNRPFGDGQDNNGNGVVDEALEAGSIYFDVNGNGARDSGEPFINANGILSTTDGEYQPPLDRAPVTATAFNYGHPADGVPKYINGNTARQRYARHLYILALLAMDENYVAPYDPDKPPQVLAWIEKIKKELTAAPFNFTPQDAELFAKKKLTYREIAQWAINCADMRDADVIMTPFEYDENPWDGWNVTEYDTAGAVLRQFAIDGDPATDENAAYYWTATGIVPPLNPPPDPPPAPVATPFQTRGLVWGAERPELLITETLAFHDRRTEDLSSIDTEGHSQLNPPPDEKDKWIDEDLDQRMRPRGSLFVEVRNPWSSDGQRPAELYSLHPRDGSGNITGIPVASPGVELGRVSDGFVRQNNVDKRSPVWRLIVVEEFPEYRSDERFPDAERRLPRPDTRVLANRSAPAAIYKSAAEEIRTRRAAFRYTDPDFPQFNYSGLPRREGVELVSGTYQFRPPKQDEDWEYSRNVFGLPYPYVEREFYFTTNYSPLLDRTNPRLRWTSSKYDVSDNDFRLRIPNRSISYSPGGAVVKAQTQKFVHRDAEHPIDPNQQIAPILPGRYGVIGSAGTQYETELPDRFTTTLGRRSNESEPENVNRFNPRNVRRIELAIGRSPAVLQKLANRDSFAAAGDPLSHQVAVFKNGGIAAPRDNELVNNVESNGAFGPAVAIPMDGMSISEPSWEYQAREAEMAEKERGAVGARLQFTQRHAKGEGMYTSNRGNPDSYDTPFDDSPELERNGTTFNYRMLHLQRLANPLLPWNPAPGEMLVRNNVQTNDTTDMHNPSLPVNPYRTVDSSSADLTSYNGVTDQQNIDAAEKNQHRPVQERTRFRDNPDQRWLLRSHERGAAAGLEKLLAGAAGNNPVRALWQQEPAKAHYDPVYFLDLLPWTDPNSAANMARKTDKMTRSNRVAENDTTETHVSMVLEHSLGFANESMGRIFAPSDGSPAVINGNATSALGAPAPDPSFVPPNEPPLSSTYPWLAWNNRPYSSAMELLQMPSGSSSELLRNYSVQNPNSQFDPYNGFAVSTTQDPDEINQLREANRRAHFGHLLNFFQSGLLPADLERQVPPDLNPGQPRVAGTVDDPQYVPNGAPNFYRLLDYVHVPSKFVGNDTLLNPTLFNKTAVAATNLPGNPRLELSAPFNRVAKYREPGRVNLNTVNDARVWDGGVLHRQLTNFALPYHPVNNPYRSPAHHLGIPFFGFTFLTDPNDPETVIEQPGLVDVRRGYGDPVSGTLIGLSAFVLHKDFPSIFGNPFRSGDAGDLVPVQEMLHAQGNVHGTMLRGFAIPAPAGSPPVPPDVAFADQTPRSDHPSFDVTRNPYLKYAALNKAGSSGTTRSNVFAVWVTVGFFEVEPAPSWSDTTVQARFGGNRALYDRVYPQGYALAQEIGAETGDLKRHRAFYIIDRTLPVGFKPGEDVNIENIIKLRRRIE